MDDIGVWESDSHEHGEGWSEAGLSLECQKFRQLLTHDIWFAHPWQNMPNRAPIAITQRTSSSVLSTNGSHSAWRLWTSLGVLTCLYGLSSRCCSSGKRTGSSEGSKAAYYCDVQSQMKWSLGL